jgi:O-acetyl-ADP-ribose deacetylase (regulator of RNase III)
VTSARFQQQQQQQQQQRRTVMPTIKVCLGDIGEVEADALITAINPLGEDYWTGRVDDVIRDLAGNQFHDQAQALQPETDGETIVARKKSAHLGAFGDVVFVVDSLVSALRSVVLAGLVAADNAGYQSVTLPMMRMGVMIGAVERTKAETVQEMVAGVRAFLDLQTESLQSITLVVHNDSEVEELLRQSVDSEPVEETGVAFHDLELDDDGAESTIKSSLANDPGWNERWSAMNQARQAGVNALDCWSAASQYNQRVNDAPPDTATAKALQLAIYTNVDFREAEQSLAAIERIRCETEALLKLAAQQWERFAVSPHFFWTGVLYAYFETGTEGVFWSLEQVPFKGHAGLHVLEDGDELTVYRADGSIRWQGTVDLEYETGYRPYPGNPQYGQQCVFGMWVHGNQRGMDPKKWAALFFGLPDVYVRGYTMKNGKSVQGYWRKVGKTNSKIRTPLRATVTRNLHCACAD